MPIGNWIYAYNSTGVTIIGYRGASTALTIPARLGGRYVTAIGDRAFAGNAKLTSVRVPGAVTAIGDMAFADCTALTWIDVAKVQTIGDEAFAGCTALKFVVVNEENRLRSIGDRAFAGCASLRSLATAGMLQSIGEDAFAGCDRLILEVLRDNFYTINYCKNHGIKFVRMEEPAEP